MKIWTSYYGKRNFGNLVQVAISIWPPKGFQGLVWKRIAPTKEMLLRYKESGDEFEYKCHYWHDVLKHYEPSELYKELERLTNGQDCVLLCYEKYGFCHRHLFATWMRKCGFDIQELPT